MSPPVTPPDERSFGWLWILALATLGICVGITMWHPFPFVEDDSLFYLVIGRNIVDGQGVTFSGLMDTNGVQPLWQVLMTGLVGICSLLGLDSPLSLVRAAVLLNWVIAVAVIWQMWTLLRELELPIPVRRLGAFVIAVALCGPFGLFASEGHLVALMVILLLRATIPMLKEDPPSWRSCVVLGVTAGLTCLARLDTVWFVAVVFLTLILPFQRRRPTSTRIVRTVAAGLVTAAVLTPYLIWNQVHFGHLLPISGALKVDTANPPFELSSAGPIAIPAILAMAVGGVICMFLPCTPALLRRMWLACLVGSGLSTGWYVAVSIGPTSYYWYLLVHIIGLTLVAVAAANAVLAYSKAPRTFRAMDLLLHVGMCLVALAAVAQVLKTATGAIQDIWQDDLAFAEGVRDATPAGGRIATVDFPGFLALVGEDRHVVAIDGLSGDYEFQDSLRDRGLSCTLADLDIRWIATADAVPAEPPATGRRPRSASPAGCTESRRAASS